MELISREMAIDHIRVLGGEDRERLIGILNNKDILPTIESRPTGKWQLLENGRYKCSECESLENATAWGNKKRHNFCWNCGADMRRNHSYER